MINSRNAALACLVVMIVWASCSGDDDDVETPEADDFDVTDDDADDDADADDDTWPPLPDDDVPGTAPVLTGGYWDPNPITNTQSSTLNFSVCDVDDDLSGGQIFISPIGEDGSDVWLNDLFWDDFVDGAPHAPDCDSPASIGITVNFDAAPADTYSVDIESTDGKGNLSNTLEGVTVEVIES